MLLPAGGGSRPAPPSASRGPIRSHPALRGLASCVPVLVLERAVRPRRHRLPRPRLSGALSPRDPSAPEEAAWGQGVRGRGAPSPGPPDREGPGPHHRPGESTPPRLPPRRAGRSGCSFPAGPVREVKGCLGLSVGPSEGVLPPGGGGYSVPDPLEQRPARAGHPRLPGITLGPAGLGWGRAAGLRGPLLAGTGAIRRAGFEPLALIKRHLPPVLGAEVPSGPPGTTRMISPPHPLLFSRNRGVLAI